MNQNVVPSSSALLTPMVPPISSQSCRAMASPRPVPPCLRVIEASTCENDSKSRSRLSAGMPMPVSRTSSRSVTVFSLWASRVTLTSTCPRLVNLTALLARFIRT